MSRRSLDPTDELERTPVDQLVPQRRGGGSGLGVVAILVAGLFILGPVLLPPAFGGTIPTESMVILMLFGMTLFLGGSFVVIVTRLYHRAPADQAFVRTGMGGSKVVLDSGTVIIPVVHEVVWVALRTMRFEVTRSGQDALITRDCLRADITAEFFVKVPKDVSSVLTAATSLGWAASDSRGVQRVLDKKLESALRQVAAEMDLQELLVNRKTFIEAVSGHVGADIKNNGLILENVTISRLDQTSTAALNPEANIFDAQGARKITEITAGQAVQRNRLQLEAQRLIEQEKVGTQKFLYEQEVLKSAAEANKQREIKVAQATANQEATTKAAELERQARLAEVARDQAVQIAQVSQAQAVDVAQQTRERAVQEAEIAKEQAVEVAGRAREIAVATKEQELAQARAAQLQAEARKMAEEQNVATVQVTATAEREKAKAVIAAQAEAERTRVQQQTAADIAAYAKVKDAQAEQEAAERQARAKLLQAEADREALKMTADGDQAVQMVPVAVAREQVEVERAKVGVQRESLSNQAEYESIAKDLQVQLARIAAEKEVQIESAKAMGVALSTAHIQIWGDPQSVAQMTQAFLRGQKLGQLADGLAAAAPSQVADLLQGLATLAQQKLGVQMTPEQVKDIMSGQSQEKP